ncbi:MAG: hypothetical protein LC104_17005, partial [Bacteroidales bacterium]|nr:hypothetical protein [Bacteroidales bacterium]
PLAVFIAAGGSEQLVAGQTIHPETLSALKAGFVCVSVDTTTDAGKTLAAAFEMSEGLVISDAAGKSQALRHAGKVTEAQLSTYSQTYTTVHSATLSALALTPACASGSCAAPVAHCGTNHCGAGHCGAGHCGTSHCGTSHCGASHCGTSCESACVSHSCDSHRGHRGSRRHRCR